MGPPKTDKRLGDYPSLYGISYPGVDIKLTSKTEASEDNINDPGLMVCSVDNCAPKDAI